MDHDIIEEQHWVDRYLMGKLPEEDVARFEEHYLHCQDCQAALRMGQHMQRGFKVAATQELMAVKEAQQVAFIAWLWRRQGVLGAVLMLVLMAGPTAWLWRHSSDLERQLQSSRASLAAVDEGRRSAQLPPAAEPSVGEGLQEQLEAQRLGYERRLQEAAQRTLELDTALAQARQPSGNTRLLYLGTERSAISQAPSHRLQLPQPAAWIVLALEVDAGGFESYRGALYNAAKEVVWQGDGLQLDIQETVNISVHSSSLAPGDYRLKLEGIADGGAKVEAVGTFALRVE